MSQQHWVSSLVECLFIIVLVLIACGAIAAGCWGCQVDCHKPGSALYNERANPAWCKDR